MATINLNLPQELSTAASASEAPDLDDGFWNEIADRLRRFIRSRVEDSHTADASVTAAVTKAGFVATGAPRSITSPPAAVQAAERAAGVTYYPLLLLATFFFGVVGLVELRIGTFDSTRAMQNFMGAFFGAFAFFKLLDLRGFADSYRMYDIVARRLPGYGYVYPFIELALGAAYIAGFQLAAVNLITLAVMSVSSVGVIRSVLQKRKIRCACLGAVFNLPMSTVTLVEDGLMIAMAAAALLGIGH